MNFRRTKIICTIGPATASYDMLEQLQRAGMNVVRLNMSHADHASATKIVGWIRTLNRKVHYPVAILLDTQGPEIRTDVAAHRQRDDGAGIEDHRSTSATASRSTTA